MRHTPLIHASVAVTALLCTFTAHAQTVQCGVDTLVDFGKVSTLGSVASTESLPWPELVGMRYIGGPLSPAEGQSPYSGTLLNNPLLDASLDIAPGHYRRVTNPFAIIRDSANNNGYLGWQFGWAHTGDPDDYFLMFDTALTGTTHQVVYSYTLPNLKAGETYDLSWYYANAITIGGGNVNTNLIFDVVDAAGNDLSPVQSLATGNLSRTNFVWGSALNWQQGNFTISPSSDLNGAVFQLKALSATGTYGSDFVFDDLAIRGDCHAIPAPVLQAQPVPATAAWSLWLASAALLGFVGLQRRRRQA